mmetsp:Transcript_20965/g.65852  ORF Transcript_20965/g.65852 Transcript_20965/m.65852 type:complete len:228 (-) Transcript_20965:1499-2182(-)
MMQSSRFDATLSISSTKIIDGALVCDRENTFRIARSDSPSHLLVNCGPCTEIRWRFDSCAMDRANRVFEHPGGPKSSIPPVERSPSWEKRLSWPLRITISRNKPFSTVHPTTTFEPAVASLTMEVSVNAYWVYSRAFITLGDLIPRLQESGNASKGSAEQNCGCSKCLQRTITLNSSCTSASATCSAANVVNLTAVGRRSLESKRRTVWRVKPFLADHHLHDISKSG